jgi:hypothetical protein
MCDATSVAEPLPQDLVRTLAARFPGDTAKGSGAELSVLVEGLTVHVRFLLRERGSSSTQSTVIGVFARDIPGPALRWFVDIRLTNRIDEKDARAGRLRDVVVDDPAFDDAYIIEAAPDDVIAAWFDDASLRRDMLSLRPPRILSGGDFGLRIELDGWLADIERLEALARLMAKMTNALGAAVEHVNGERRRAAADLGYRDRALTQDEVEHQRDVDLAALHVQRRRRFRRDAILGLGLAVVFIAGIFAVIFLAIHYAEKYGK